MEKNDSLILTGWGYAEYVASAAVALRALGGRADVFGVSRRRLPEFLTELAMERDVLRWRRIYILGVALGGAPDALAAALAKLKAMNGMSRLGLFVWICCATVSFPVPLSPSISTRACSCAATRFMRSRNATISRLLPRSSLPP